MGRGGGPRSFALVANAPGTTDVALLRAFRTIGLTARLLRPDQVQRFTPAAALGRIGVRPALDGVEPGLAELEGLDNARACVLNGAAALLTCHDKLQTALRLSRVGLPHPATSHVNGESFGAPDFPVVVKPRFGTGGKEVARCDTAAELRAHLESIRDRRWFARHGALVQELVPDTNWDLRVVVAAGEVVGAAKRVAPPGGWKTSSAPEDRRVPADPPSDARELAVEAARAAEVDLVTVDLLATRDGFVVLDLNGAPDLDHVYSQADGSVYEDAARRLAAAAGFSPAERRSHPPPAGLTAEIGRRG